MIDCHAHIFPSPAFLLPWATKIKNRLLKKIPITFPTLPVDIESVVKLRENMPHYLRNMSEWLMSIGIAPQVLLRSDMKHLLRSMDDNGIHQTVVIAAERICSNQWLLEQVKSLENNRLIPVAAVPKLKEDISSKEWTKLFTDLVEAGVAGFKIHSNLDNLEPSHIAYKALFRVAKTHQKFVILHTGCFHVPGYPMKGPADPTAFVKLFKAFPTVNICLAHMNRDEPDVVWQLMKRFDNIYTDTSWQGSETIRRAIDTIGDERILLGSDWPLLHGDLQRDAITTLRRACSDKEFLSITTSNAQRFIHN